MIPFSMSMNIPQPNRLYVCPPNVNNSFTHLSQIIPYDQTVPVGCMTFALPSTQGIDILASNNNLRQRGKNQSRPVSKVVRTSKDCDGLVHRDFGPLGDHKFFKIPLITEDQAKLALTKYVNQKYCFKKNPLKQLVFTQFESSNTDYYSLTTFVESRQSVIDLQPYNLYKNGPIKPVDKHLDIKSVDCKPKCLFQDEQKDIEIPHTAHLRRCESCLGTGSDLCDQCQGYGMIPCKVCNCKGNRPRPKHIPENESNSCTFCKNKTGYKICSKCNSECRLPCGTCQGFGQMRRVIKVIVSYKTYKNEYLKKSILDEKLIIKCEKSKIFEEEQDKVFPIRTYNDEDINRVSIDFCNEHESKFSNFQILKQKHGIYAIPITLCKFEWKDNKYTFYVYGLDHKVYAPDYPKRFRCKCCNCCCCSVC